MEYFSNEFYVYQVDNSLMSDMDLLSLAGTSVQTLRVGDSLYFGVSAPLTGSGYTLIREPIVDNGGNQ